MAPSSPQTRASHHNRNSPFFSGCQCMSFATVEVIVPRNTAAGNRCRGNGSNVQSSRRGFGRAIGARRRRGTLRKTNVSISVIAVTANWRPIGPNKEVSWGRGGRDTWGSSCHLPSYLGNGGRAISRPSGEGARRAQGGPGQHDEQRKLSQPSNRGPIRRGGQLMGGPGAGLRGFADLSFEG